MNNLIGEINGIKVYTKDEVPENEVWFEDSHRPNPTYAGGLLDTIAFTKRTMYVKDEKTFQKIKLSTPPQSEEEK